MLRGMQLCLRVSGYLGARPRMYWCSTTSPAGRLLPGQQCACVRVRGWLGWGGHWRDRAYALAYSLDQPTRAMAPMLFGRARGLRRARGTAAPNCNRSPVPSLHSTTPVVPRHDTPPATAIQSVPAACKCRASEPRPRSITEEHACLAGVPRRAHARAFVSLQSPATPSQLPSLHGYYHSCTAATAHAGLGWAGLSARTIWQRRRCGSTIPP